jgi:prepilin signal peptidase PulO-like enzyme (type II secretory pathway)
MPTATDLTAIAPFVTAYLVLVGLLCGSFINLAADRIPRAESLVSPRSHCRSCGRQLNAIDLLPVLGYALRAGRCATCGAEIGRSSPLVEAASGALVLIPILWLGLWPGAAAGLALVAVWGVAVVGLAMRRGAIRA